MRQNRWQVTLMHFTHPVPHGCGVSWTHASSPKAFSTSHIRCLMMGTGMRLWMRHGAFPSNLTVPCHFWKRWGMHCDRGPDTGKRLLSRGSQWKDGDFAGTIRAPNSAPELTLGRGLEWVHRSEKLQPKAKDVSILLSEVTKGCLTHRAEGLLACHRCLPYDSWLIFYLRGSFKAHFGFWWFGQLTVAPENCYGTVLSMAWLLLPWTWSTAVTPGDLHTIGSIKIPSLRRGGAYEVLFLPEYLWPLLVADSTVVTHILLLQGVPYPRSCK